MHARLHTVERLELALAQARKVGYTVREEWLGGNGSGFCVVKGRKWLFLDVAQGIPEQLAVVEEALQGEGK
jgi:hypothetical protein